MKNINKGYTADVNRQAMRQQNEIGTIASGASFGGRLTPEQIERHNAQPTQYEFKTREIL